MAFSQQKFREIVFQLLYSRDFAVDPGEGGLFLLMEQLAVTKKIVRLAMEKQEQIWEKKETLDTLIASVAQDYSFERIPRIERNILRLGVFELFHSGDVPPKVAISEAIRLSRKFATHEAANFVNALLDALYAPSPAEQCSAK